MLVSKIESNMFAQISTAFDACRDVVTAAVKEQQQFQEEVRRCLKKKDEEIDDLKDQLKAMASWMKELSTQRDLKELKEKVQIEAQLTAVEFRVFRGDLGCMRTFLAKKFEDRQDASVQITEDLLEESDEERLQRIKMEDLARDLALLKA